MFYKTPENTYLYTEHRSPKGFKDVLYVCKEESGDTVRPINQLGTKVPESEIPGDVYEKLTGRCKDEILMHVAAGTDVATAYVASLPETPRPSVEPEAGEADDVDDLFTYAPFGFFFLMWVVWLCQ